MEQDMLHNALLDDFNERVNQFMFKQQEEFKHLKGKEKKIRQEKFSFLKSKKVCFPRYDEIIGSLGYTEDELFTLKKLHILKVKGTYKHAQSKKTAICNSIVLLNISDGLSTMCIAKDTLAANQQWFERLLKDRKDAFPKNEPYIYIVSSSNPKKSYMEYSNIKHFKTIESYITYIASTKSQSPYSQDPYILFVCSNDTRVSNLKTILDVSMKLKYIPLFDIIWDEAHNPKEGIPSKRSLSEMLIIHPRVRTFIPCTATIDDLIEESTLFQLENLEANAIDYTSFNDFKSDSPEYSSLHNAKHIYLEDLRALPNYKDYKVTHYEKELFKRHYNESEIRKKYKNEEEEIVLRKIEEDFEKKRPMEYHPFMLGEKQFYNDGLNLIHNIHGLFTDGIHLIHTPLRNAFTESLIVEALKQPYRPIAIGLYDSAIHVWDGSTYIQILEKGLLNEQVKDILNKIKKRRKITVVLIFGNYSPTGESISFYHPEYGPLKSDTLLGFHTPSNAYQAFARLNYVKPDKVEPKKFMVGEKKSIENALLIEKQNDLRIDRFRSNERSETSHVIFKRKQENTDDSNISIPVRLEYEGRSPNITRMLEICGLSKKNDEQRAEFMKLLFCEIASGNIAMVDPTGKLNDSYKINTIRRYIKPDEKKVNERREAFESKGKPYKPYEEDYRFDSYSASHREKVSYMNEKNKVDVGECEMLCCQDKYILNKADVPFTNSVNVFWISYRFV